MKCISSVICVCIMITLILSISGCVHKDSIADIIDNPSQYEGEIIYIQGDVRISLWFNDLNNGAYLVTDGSDNIWVVTTEKPPASGTWVSVQGTVRTAFSFDNLVLSPVVNETKRD